MTPRGYAERELVLLCASRIFLEGTFTVFTRALTRIVGVSSSAMKKLALVFFRLHAVLLSTVWSLQLDGIHRGIAETVKQAE